MLKCVISIFDLWNLTKIAYKGQLVNQKFWLQGVVNSGLSNCLIKALPLSYLLTETTRRENTRIVELGYFTVISWEWSPHPLLYFIYHSAMTWLKIFHLLCLIIENSFIRTIRKNLLRSHPHIVFINLVSPLNCFPQLFLNHGLVGRMKKMHPGRKSKQPRPEQF